MSSEHPEKAPRSSQDASGDRYGQPPPHPSFLRRPDPFELVGSMVRHYEILEWCGGGGMGVVYKGFDTRLRRHVALKFLPITSAEEESARVSLITEARAASTLDHGNICTVYEIGETEQGRIFIAMAFYEGETLKKKLGTGPLPFDRAIDYSIEIAHGLSKAHDEGIVHRDIKPANVMITAGGSVKLLDFGIAKTVEFRSAGGEKAVGTLGYASPEQVNGDPVDHRTDVWSLGVLMYQLFTGVRPFNGPSDVAIVHAVTFADPEPPTELNPAVPHELERLILKCLEKDKGHRYAHVADLLKELEALRERLVRQAATGLASGGDPSAEKDGRGRPFQAKSIAAAMIFLLILASAANPAVRTGVASWVFPVPESARTHIAVLPLTLVGPIDEATRALADGLVQSFTSMITRLQAEKDSLWVVPAAEIARASVITSSDAKRLFNVSAVLTGTLRVTGSAVEIDLELVDPDRLHVIDSREIPGPLDPEFEWAALEALRDLLGVPSPTQAPGRLAQQEVANPGARDFYLRGVGYLAGYYRTESVETAIDLFSRAIAEDPVYAAAHAGLCEAKWEQYRQGGSTSIAEEALESCDRARSIAEEQPTVLSALGRIYLEQGELTRAEVSLNRVLELEPGSAEAKARLALVYEEQGRLEEAEQAYREAVESDRSVWIYYLKLGEFLAYHSRHDEALEQFEWARQLSPDNHLPYLGIGYSRLRQNETEDAETLFELSLEKQETHRAYFNIGYFHVRNLEFDEAIRAFERGLALGPRDFSIWRWLGHALHWTERPAEAREAWREVVEIAEGLLPIERKDGLVLTALAEAYVVLGQPDEGRRYLDQLLALEGRPTFLRYEIARIYEILGDRETALTHLERALDNGFDRVFAQRDPWLEGLRDDPRYEELLQLLDRTD